MRFTLHKAKTKDLGPVIPEGVTWYIWDTLFDCYVDVDIQWASIANALNDVHEDERVRSCGLCKHRHLGSNEGPCLHCYLDDTLPNFQPKDSKEV